LEVKRALRDRSLPCSAIRAPRSAATSHIEKELAQAQGDIEPQIAQRDYCARLPRPCVSTFNYDAGRVIAGYDFSPIKTASTASARRSSRQLLH